MKENNETDKEGASTGVGLERLVRPDEVRDKIHDFLWEKYSGEILTDELIEDVKKELTDFCMGLSDEEKLAMHGTVNIQSIRVAKSIGKVNILCDFEVRGRTQS